MKSTFVRGLAVAVMTGGLLASLPAARADTDEVRAQCQADAQAAGIEDPAELQAYIEQCIQAASGETQGEGAETTPSS
jgi:hypothetical protein